MPSRSTCRRLRRDNQAVSGVQSRPEYRAVRQGPLRTERAAVSLQGLYGCTAASISTADVRAQHREAGTVSYVRADGGIVGASSVGGYVRADAARAGREETVQGVSGPSWTVEMPTVEVDENIHIPEPRAIILRANQTWPWRPVRLQPRRLSRRKRKRIKQRTNNKTTSKGSK